MKKLLILLLLVALPLVAALPSNYNAPLLIANATVNADITRYADADGIVNGLTSGGNRLFGVRTGTNDFIVSSENGTTLKVQAYTAATVFGMYYHDSEQKLYIDRAPQGRMDAWRMDNPLAPVLNGTWTHSGNTRMTVFDESEDRMFMVPINPELAMVLSHSTTGGWSEDYIPAHFIVDRFTIGSNLYYAGGFYAGGTDYFIVLDDALDLVANVSTTDLTTFDGVTYANNYLNHFFVIDADYAIESNKGSASHLISINDFNDFSELAVGCGASFYPLDAYGLDYIIGFDIDTDTFHICDATEITSISTEDTGVYIGYNETSTANPDITILGGGRVSLGPNDEYLWDLQEQAAGTTGTETGLPPVYRAEFLGVDDARENFVFEVRLQDVDGGNTFYAFDLNEEGEFINATGSEVINFDDADDLSFVSNVWCPDSFNITYDTPFGPFTPFGSDGALLMNNTDCGAPITSVLFSAAASPLDAEDNITAVTSIAWSPNSEYTGVDEYSSVSLYSSDNKNLDRMTFYYNVSSSILYVYDRDYNLMGNTSFSLTNFVSSVTSEIDFLANTVKHTVGWSGGTIAEYTVTFFETSANDFQEYVFNQDATYGWNTYVDYVSYSYEREGPDSLPAYRTFGYLAPNSPISKAHYEPIGPFGNYEWTLYGTDVEYGTSYYADPNVGSFTYNSLTPTLTQAEIDDIIAAGGGSVEGDLATDLLPSLLERIGATTTGSRMIIGFVILLAIAFIVADFGAAVAVLILGAAFITLAIIGLFPLWFVTIMVIIAAVLVAVSFRTILQGGGGS